MYLKFFEYKKFYKFIFTIIIVLLVLIIFPNKIYAATNCVGKIINLPANTELQEDLDIRNYCLGPEIYEFKETLKQGPDITYKIKWNEPKIGKKFSAVVKNSSNKGDYEFQEYQIWYVSPSGSGSISVANYNQRELDFKTSAGMGDSTTTTVKVVALYTTNNIFMPKNTFGEGPSKSNSPSGITADAPQLNGSGNYDKNSKKATVQLNWFLKSNSKPSKYNLYKWINSHKPSLIKNFNSGVLNFEETFSLNLAKGETATYNYSIEAVYEALGIKTQQANSNIVTITFTGEDNGDVSSQTGTNAPPSTPELHNNTDPGTLPSTPTKSQCESKCKKQGRNIVEEYVCKSVCWISTAIMGVLNCGFETLRASLVPQAINWSNCLNTSIEGSGGGGGGGETPPAPSPTYIDPIPGPQPV